MSDLTIMHQPSCNRILSHHCQASSLIVSGSRNWDAVEVALDRAFVEGVHACGRSEHFGIDLARSREMGGLVFGLKSACGNGWQGLAGFQWKRYAPINRERPCKGQPTKWMKLPIRIGLPPFTGKA